MEKVVRCLLGEYLKVYIAYSCDRKIRLSSASGGVATVLLKYLLEAKHVEAIIVPKSSFRGGLMYGVWTIIRDPNEVNKYSGSLYATTFGFLRVINCALSRFRRIAVTTLPCHTRAIKRFSQLRGNDRDVFIIGLYCNNTPSMWATRYALKYFNIRAEDVERVKFRGRGWPGYTTIETKSGTIQIPYPAFWDSGFGQYFYGLSCYLCSDQTNSLADISLADPWTLPHEPVKRLGGATLVVIRTKRGLEIFEGAVRAGYVEAVEVDPVYAVQDATLLKLSKRVLKRCSDGYALPPGFTTIAHELVYHVGRFLASREPLWPLLRIYHKVVAPLTFKAASLLDHKLKTRWARVRVCVKLLQKIKVPEGVFAK